MTQTATEVRNRALRKLGVLGLGETPDSTMAADMDQVYAEVYARLEEEHLTTWASDADIPDLMAGPVADLCALERVDEYPTSQLRYEKIARVAGENGKNALAKIRARKNGTYQSETTYVEYF